MNIRVFEKFDDIFLKSEWERLEQETDVFPQSSYHWCATWWKHLRGRRKLHVVMALDSKGRAIAIAPLCIERHFGVKVLRSFPIHFGDYYTFITSKEGCSNCGVETIFKFISDSTNWAWVRLEQVVETDELAHLLSENGYMRKRLTGSVIANFQGLSWDAYKSKLPRRRFREYVRSRQRKIDKDFEAFLTAISCWEAYSGEYDTMRAIHELRWSDDNAPHKSDIEIACWREAIKRQFEDGKMVYYQLLFCNQQAAYRLGFVHHGTYYDWHLGFNPEYREYYPGIMSMAYVIQSLIEQGITTVNFMAGEYDWKLDWSPDRTVVSHYMFTSPSTNYRAAFLNFYHHRLRDKLKDWYHTMMKNWVLRAISRKIITIQQRIAGQR